jgi:hypothetical protein
MSDPTNKVIEFRPDIDLSALPPEQLELRDYLKQKQEIDLKKRQQRQGIERKRQLQWDLQRMKIQAEDESDEEIEPVLVKKKNQIQYLPRLPRAKIAKEQLAIPPKPKKIVEVRPKVIVRKQRSTKEVTPTVSTKEVAPTVSIKAVAPTKEVELQIEIAKNRELENQLKVLELEKEKQVVEIKEFERRRMEKLKEIAVEKELEKERMRSEQIAEHRERERRIERHHDLEDQKELIRHKLRLEAEIEVERKFQQQRQKELEHEKLRRKEAEHLSHQEIDLIKKKVILLTLEKEKELDNIKEQGLHFALDQEQQLLKVREREYELTQALENEKEKQRQMEWELQLEKQKQRELQRLLNIEVEKVHEALKVEKVHEVEKVAEPSKVEKVTEPSKVEKVEIPIKESDKTKVNDTELISKEVTSISKDSKLPKQTRKDVPKETKVELIKEVNKERSKDRVPHSSKEVNRETLKESKKEVSTEALKKKKEVETPSQSDDKTLVKKTDPKQPAKDSKTELIKLDPKQEKRQKEKQLIEAQEVEISKALVKQPVKKQSEMVPHPRAPPEHMQKTVIVFKGKSREGKTTLCQYLVSDKVNYISLDHLASNLDWSDIKEIKVFRQSLKDPHHSIDRINRFINDHHSYKFMDQFFKKFLLNNKETYFVLEGHFFILQRNYDNLVELCKKYNVRLWIGDRKI